MKYNIKMETMVIKKEFVGKISKVKTIIKKCFLKKIFFILFTTKIYLVKLKL